MANLFWLSGRAWEDANGNPYPAAVAHFYVVGTTTNQDTYTSASLATPNANPVVSDASTGIFGEIHFAAKRYKCVVKDASGNTLKTFEVIDATQQLIASASAPSPTYPFLRYHNTSDGHVYRRNAADSAWIDEGAVDSLLNAASVTEQLAGTATDKSSTPDSVAGIWQRGDNLTPSGGTVTLTAGGGGVFNVAAGNFSAISTAVGGRSVLFVFGGTSVITHNATSMILPGGANITTEAGDCARFVNEAATDVSGTNWRCVWFARDSTTLAAVPNYAATQAEMETATSLLRWVTPGRQQYHPGTCKAWVKFSMAAAINASHNVASIDDDGAANFGINFTTAFSSTHYCAVEATVATANNKISFANMATTDIDADLFRSDDTGSETNTTSAMCAFFGDQ